MPENLPPPRALSRVVDAFWRHEGPSGTIRVLPDGCMDFLFDLERGTARVIGTMSTAALVTLPEGTRLFGVRFRPGLAARYLADPAHAFVDVDAPLDIVASARRTHLAEQIASAPSDTARCALVSDYLGRPENSARPYDPRVTRAVEWLRAEPGGGTVRSAARRLGISERQLERLFDAHVGIGPKLFARVARLERTLSVLGARIGDQAALAAAGGYADESHLIRDFRQLAGATPAELLRERHVGFVQAS